MNFPLIITSIIALIEVFLAILVYIRDPRSKVHRWFVFLLGAILAWVIPMIFYNVWEDREIAFLWMRFRYVGPLFIPTTFTFFTYVFLNNTDLLKERIILALLFIPNIIFGLISGLTDLVLKDIAFSYEAGFFDVYSVFGPLYPVYMLYYIVYFAWGDINLFRNFGANRLRNAQIFYILAGSFIATIIGMVTNLFLPYVGNFQYFWLGSVATLIFGVFIIYAILAHHILNISIVSTEIFTGILIILFLLNVFTFSSPQDFFFKTSIFVGGLIIGFLLVTRSLRELRQLQDIETLNIQLQKSLEELRKIDELKTEFVSLASHQLRTPLTPIKGYADMLRKGDFGGPLENPEQRKAVDSIYLSAQRMVDLIDDLLDVSKLEKEGGFTYNFQIGNPEPVIKKIVDEMQNQAKDKGVALTFGSNLPGEAAIKFDTSKFVDALGNVINNAVKYTKEGNVWVTLTDDDGNVVISVKDTGVGISPEDIDKLFQKFFRGKEVSRLATEGAGLGLYFTKRVIEDHGGHIEAKSEGQGKGSEFIITLPKATEQTQVQAQPPGELGQDVPKPPQAPSS